MFSFGVKMDGKVNLDSAGLSGVLTGPQVSSIVLAAANQIAANARSLIPAGSHFYKEPGASIVVERYTAGGGRLLGRRAAAKVVVKYSKAAGLQARYGILTKSVAAQGLSVRRRRS